MKFYEITTMSEAYIESFAAALDSVARERQYLGLLEAPAMEDIRAFVHNAMQSNWIYLISVSQGQVVGWCNIDKMNRPIFLHAGRLGIGVIADYPGIGVGKALIQQALLLAKHQGYVRISLTVREPNKRAIALYEKMGFVHEGVHKKAIYLDGCYEDEYSMGLLFE